MGCLPLVFQTWRVFLVAWPAHRHGPIDTWKACNQDFKPCSLAYNTPLPCSPDPMPCLASHPTHGPSQVAGVLNLRHQDDGGDGQGMRRLAHLTAAYYIGACMLGWVTVRGT